MNSFQKFFVSSALLLNVSARAACHYSADPAQTHVGWAAFKTTQKVAVKGEFKTFTLTAAPKASSVVKLLKSAKIEIDAKSSNSGNPVRDQKIVGIFFGKMTDAKIKGVLNDIKGNDSEGTAQLKLTMNGKTESLPVKYKVTEATNLVTITGTLDVVKVGLESALGDLNKACYDLHKGPDGVSKTWSTVDIEIASTLKADCS